jgi:DNA-binding response OmpR family regulator/two-component sensor histidine kinase
MRKQMRTISIDTASASVSHDMKTLINGVLCMSSLLEATPLSIEQAEIVQLLRKSSSELSLMMTQILEKSKPHSYDLLESNDPFSIEEEVNYIFQTFRLTLKKKTVKTALIIEPSVPATVKGNKLALNRILNNLLQNAGKFTESGNIKLHVKNKKNQDGKSVLLFEISDTGIGIAPENLDTIFTRFTKYNSEGYGIGLATTKELVDSLDGSIGVESTLNAGTKFSVEIPFEVTHFAATKKSIPLSIKALKNEKVLIVDDDIVYKKYLTTILNQYQADITLAQTGIEALQLIDNQCFDLIILDLNLPELNGYETAMRIRHTDNLNQHTPIVGMSASDADREKIKACGMDDILPKPLSAEALTLRLQHVLEQKKPKITPYKSQNIHTKSNFNFNLKLDVKHLNALYGHDIEHAAMIFETFLEESLPQYYTILDALEAQNYAEISVKAHRFKTAFSMVGFRKTHKKLYAYSDCPNH